MEVLVVGHDQVKDLLPMEECIEVIEGVFRTLARGDVVLPLRQAVWQPDRKGLLGMMPAYLGSPQAIGGKFVTVFPGNSETPFESHQGVVLLFECENGRLQAIVDASSITAIRTAAASGVATRALARGDAHDLAILGSGTQASMHLSSMRAVRNISKVRVWSRNIDHARRFANFSSGKGTPPIEAVESPERAARNADIICTTTGATEPVLKGEWISPGAHVNAVGASVPPYRELDSQAVARSRLYTDRRESLLSEADDFRIPRKEGRITDDHLRGVIGEVLVERVAGRTNDEEITLFKSLGLAVEDLAAAIHVYLEAKAKGLGNWIEFSGVRE